MVRSRPPKRTCFVHIGTHKTGSTALQYFLFKHALQLAAQGVYVPASGRLADSPEGCGHHCLAWDLLGADPSSPISGTVESLIAEIQAQSLPVVCVSSEELEHLHVTPNNLQRLHAGLSGIGYRTVILLYLRPQADLLEALYAEVTRHAPVRDFWECYREMLTHGAVDLWPENRFTAMFDYERLIAPFASIVGQHNIIVRPFRRHREPGRLIDDFVQVVTRRRTFAGSRRKQLRGEHVNARVTFNDVLRGIRVNRREVRDRPVEPFPFAATSECDDGPFDPLRLHEMIKIGLRFGLSNARLFLRYGVVIGCVSRRQLTAAAASVLRGNDAKSRRYRMLRRVFSECAESATPPSSREARNRAVRGAGR